MVQPFASICACTSSIMASTSSGAQPASSRPLLRLQNAQLTFTLQLIDQVMRGTRDARPAHQGNCQSNPSRVPWQGKILHRSVLQDVMSLKREPPTLKLVECLHHLRSSMT